MKPKKQAVTFETKFQGVTDSSVGISIKRAVIDGESYYSATDFLKYLLLLEKHNRQITQGYIVNELYHLGIDSEKFWSNSENEVFFDVVLSHIESYGDWMKSKILNQFFLSNLVIEDKKQRYLNNAKNIPLQTYKLVSTSKIISPSVRSLMLSKFKAEEEMILEIIATEEDKEVLNAALDTLDIDKITSQNIISMYIQERGLNIRKKVRLIQKATNLEVLNHLIFNDSDFEIVKAARVRIKEIPNSVKFIMSLQEEVAA